jgi:hypothetical protein
VSADFHTHTLTQMNSENTVEYKWAMRKRVRQKRRKGGVQVANDLMLGIPPCERDGSPAFVFDLMEPERPKIDRAVLAFLKLEVLHPADFTIREDRAVRLNPELARRVARQCSL